MVMVSGGGGNAWAKEMTLRRRIASIFNKTQEHFPTLKDYNDYLEEVEDMNVEEIEAKIARYQQENAEQIYLSRAKRAEDLAAALKASRMNPVKAEANDTAAGSSQGISGGAGVQGQYAPAAVLGGVAQPRPTDLPFYLINQIHFAS
ncbi:CDK-activating kinase assembly factor MAT1 [Zea mays]|uniref:CDK-activating kinase assembly factor MAT1 n=1 Tax=Zea mays TaxID=4577 RepID=A0A3L6DAE2_MAIZE|nr:CDK-activating kinase assembly factor MAT1 [Zea mays]